jgi:hypothetical protein
MQTLFGFPIWIGRIKRRRVKKHLGGRRWLLSEEKQSEFSRLGVGDFVNDCTGLNGRILEVRPCYFGVGRAGSSYLYDVDLVTTNTSCSLCSCGVEPKLSREEIERRKVEFAKVWALDESGEPGTAKYWYGEDVAAYERTVANSKRMIAEIESGGHVLDEDGMLLEAWKDAGYFM